MTEATTLGESRELRLTLNEIQAALGATVSEGGEPPVEAMLLRCERCRCERCRCERCRCERCFCERCRCERCRCERCFMGP